MTILDEDGGAKIDLANLPPDLQKRFNYDATKATEIIAQRAADSNAVKQQAIDSKLVTRNITHVSGRILQIIPNAVLINIKTSQIQMFDKHAVASRENINLWNIVYIKCDTSHLVEGQDWNGDVWQIGMYYFDSDASAQNIIRKRDYYFPSLGYTLGQDSSINVTFMNTVVNTHRAIPWYSTTSSDLISANTILSTTITSLQVRGNKFNDRFGSTYLWKSITPQSDFSCGISTTTFGQTALGSYTGTGSIEWLSLPLELAKALVVSPEEIDQWNSNQTNHYDIIQTKIKKGLEASTSTVISPEQGIAAMNQRRDEGTAAFASDLVKAEKAAMNITPFQNDEVLYDDDLKNQLDIQWLILRAANDYRVVDPV